MYMEKRLIWAHSFGSEISCTHGLACGQGAHPGGNVWQKKKKVIHFKTRLLSFEEAKEAEVPFKAAVTY